MLPCHPGMPGPQRLFQERNMEDQNKKDPCSTATSAASSRPKRCPRRQQTSQVSTDERGNSASGLAPTATVLLNKEEQELKFLKEKLEWQNKKIEELEEERDFLRGQLSALTARTPSEIVCRYKSILKALPKAKTMTRAFQKHTIDRNTVVSTSANAELAFAAPEVYEEALAKRPNRETVLAFAKQFEASIFKKMKRFKNKIESMKA
ncbi:hypothetical protein NFI96_021701 [Prochilodus magdalenae]|nr:hypothetical protein NFI96_021701 [Prochilodus magdalenae]